MNPKIKPVVFLHKRGPLGDTVLLSQRYAFRQSLLLHHRHYPVVLFAGMHVPASDRKMGQIRPDAGDIALRGGRDNISFILGQPLPRDPHGGAFVCSCATLRLYLGMARIFFQDPFTQKITVNRGKNDRKIRKTKFKIPKELHDRVEP